MENIELPVNKIRRAQIRYIKEDNPGCEVPPIMAYTYFLELTDGYINVFHPAEECNVYKRVEAHFNKEGKPYGTKIELVSGIDTPGVCYVLDRDYKIDYPEEYISYEDFEKLIIDMDEFIVDRISIYMRKNSLKDKIKNRKKRKEDYNNLLKLQEYILSIEEKSKVYKKI